MTIAPLENKPFRGVLDLTRVLRERAYLALNPNCCFKPASVRFLCELNESSLTLIAFALFPRLDCGCPRQVYHLAAENGVVGEYANSVRKQEADRVGALPFRAVIATQSHDEAFAFVRETVSGSVRS